jgi:hypothetical protein
MSLREGRKVLLDAAKDCTENRSRKVVMVIGSPCAKGMGLAKLAWPEAGREWGNLPKSELNECHYLNRSRGRPRKRAHCTHGGFYRASLVGETGADGSAGSVDSGKEARDWGERPRGLNLNRCDGVFRRIRSTAARSLIPINNRRSFTPSLLHANRE